MLIGLLVALLAMVLNSGGALLAASAAGRATRARPIAVQPRYLGALLVDLVAWLCAAVALRHLPVFAVQAVIGGSIAVTVVASARMTETRLRRTTRTAVGVCLAGLLLVAASAGADRPPVTSRVVDVILIGAVLVLGVTVLVLRQYRRGWPLAVVAGLGFGGTALAVRAAHVEVGAGFSPALLLGQPATYLVVGFVAVGMIGWSAALGRGDVGPMTAVLIVTEVVLPGLVGIALLGDPVRAGWGWPLAIGLATAVAGVVVLARTPPRIVRLRASGLPAPVRPRRTAAPSAGWAHAELGRRRRDRGGAAGGRGVDLVPHPIAEGAGEGLRPAPLRGGGRARADVWP